MRCKMPGKCKWTNENFPALQLMMTPIKMSRNVRFATAVHTSTKDLMSKTKGKPQSRVTSNSWSFLRRKARTVETPTMKRNMGKTQSALDTPSQSCSLNGQNASPAKQKTINFSDQ